MILKRYINGEIIRSCAAILVVLLLIFISTRFIKYIQLAVDGSISSQAMFSLLGLQIPAVVGFLIPLSFFIAILLSFGRLYAEHEMAVIHSVGVGELQLAKYIFPAAIGLSLLSAVLSFGVTPWSHYQSKSLLVKEKAAAKFGVFSPGRFQQTPDQDGVVFIGSRDEEGVIHHLFVVQGMQDNAESLKIQSAERGRFWKQLPESSNSNKEQNYLVLEEGRTHVFDNLTQQWQQTEYESYFMKVAPVQTGSLSLRTKSISTPDLLKNPGPAEWAELHWRLSAPLSILILCYMAIPLARTQPRKGKFSRLFPAIMVYLVYALLMMNSRSLLERGKVPIELGFWWIHSLAIIFCVWLYRPQKSGKNNRSSKAQVSHV